MIEAVAGIDEAGRGPLVGDMFLVCVVLREDSLTLLRDAGVRDSKALTRSSRMKLFPTIVNTALKLFVKRFPPNVIDETNINLLLAKGVAELIRKACSVKGIKLRKVYIDDIGGRKAHSIIMSSVPSECGARVIIEPKADSKYVAVSAASVIAKCLRDMHVEGLHKLWGDFGSGYPSDPKLRAWLRNIVNTGKIPPIVRRSWKTFRNAVGSQNLTRWMRGKVKV